ncbi:NACHT, LRR and PYD domains-containing protein 1b allele 3-like [Melanotaenia boesemani]|uniref:NACHT, LRR and PYD domains-containing protein 1b allele 3-like n=1 Tax=Melanotaenia boesemani TaxID=1250792 RepID=UPI001C05B5A0|nr:NACHT, LRR and PYD domains-containing protein 1b allele 3-like [Melanotaenia boesemani]
MTGTVQRTGKSGFLPSNYVECVSGVKLDSNTESGSSEDEMETMKASSDFTAEGETESAQVLYRCSDRTVKSPSDKIVSTQPVYRALYDFKALEEDEVSFTKDDIIIINSKPVSDGWMTGTVQRTGKSGFLPSNYVECVSGVKLDSNTESGSSEDEMETMKAPLDFTPEVETESAQVLYRFKCPGPGSFQCALTGLVFVTAHEVEIQYRTDQWDEKLLQSAGKTPAGPLFNIKCSEDAVHQLHLPHCETKEALLSGGVLSVLHISDDGMSILEPLQITETHVIVKVPHLSAFGLVWDLITGFLNMKPIKGQVLLFLRLPNTETQKQNLDVFLLPSNIPVKEVCAQHEDSEYVKVPPTCKLIRDQSYSVHCPVACMIQPPREDFDPDFGPNYHPTFEIRLPTNTKEVTITVRDHTDTEVWEREVDLPGQRGETPQRNVPGVSLEDQVPAEDRLLSARTQFISRVSEPNLDKLLDKLLERGVINEEEMESARTKARAEKARDVIDTVQRKGTEASSVLIAALREVDLFLSKVLNLH